MALAGAVSLAPSTVLAQSAAAPAAMAAVASPAQFRTTVLTSGAFAMQTSQVALERSPSPRVQEFAQLEINEQMALAAALGAAPGSAPLRPDPRHPARAERLEPGWWSSPPRSDGEGRAGPQRLHQHPLLRR